MTTLEEVLDNYLESDLRVLRNTSVGYPVLATVFAGIELLGALLSSQPFNGYAGLQYFSDYWTQNLYPYSSTLDQAKAIYQLARHGVAHQYFVKGLISVMSGSPSQHLTYDGTCLWIDVHALTDDLLASYRRSVKPLLQGGNRVIIQKRFKEIIVAGQSQSANQNLQSIFPPTPPVVNVASISSHGPTGPIT
jgi:hypothetical protein